MKHAYRWARPLLAALFLFIGLDASAQAWRPFRPGLIYSYALRNGSTQVHTLRVDSVYRTTAGDSVYAFNRLMRRPAGNTYSYVKSRDNLFGARISWQSGQSFYTFESIAQTGLQGASSLRIYPRAAAGQSWVASTAPMLTATVQSRAVAAILPGVQDSVATIELRNGTATTGTPVVSFILSRDHGLVEGTPWLGSAAAGTAASAPQMSALPAPLMQTVYNPLVVFAMQPGDEMGYFNDPFTFNPIPCSQTYWLRRILTRQQRADSLVFTYAEQSRHEQFSAPFCGSQTAGVTISPIAVNRLAISLQTGRSSKYNYTAMPLLTGEYASVAVSWSPYTVVMGLPLEQRQGGGCSGTGLMISYQWLYPTLGMPVSSGSYYPGLDDAPWQQDLSASLGLGDVRTDDSQLVYYKRSVGNPLTCGSPVNFVNLLPTRAAQAASVATLHPNPATEAATLTLATPARPGSALRLTDALGRLVWSNNVPTGQTTVTVPMGAQPSGLYLLRLNDAEGTSATWKLNHQ